MKLYFDALLIYVLFLPKILIYILSKNEHTFNFAIFAFCRLWQFE